MIPKKLSALFGLILCIACEQKEKTEQVYNAPPVEIITKDTSLAKIVVDEIKRKAVLFGENIQLLNSDYKPVKDISNLNGQLADILEVGDSYNKEYQDDKHCEEFKYVKIKIKDLEGFVDGRKVYEAYEGRQNKTVEIDGNELKFTCTRYFGVGISEDYGLTGCSVFLPVLFSDKNSGYEGFVPILRNKLLESDCPYFELKDDDGSDDAIEKVEKQGDDYYIKINRNYQDGGARLLIKISKDKTGNFTAELLKKE